MAICDICGENRTQLARHKKYVHGEGLVKQVCGVDGCKFECNDKDNLKKHKTNKHDIDVKWHHCDFGKCKMKFKMPGDLKRHKQTHGIGAGLFGCEDCGDRFNTNTNLKRHIKNVHKIDTVWYYCNHKKCNYKTTSKATRDSHINRKHCKNPVLYKCDFEKCTYISKGKPDLYRHKQNIHNVNVKWFYCHICAFQTKASVNLKEHLSYRHDIGDKICDFCAYPRYKLTCYKNKGHKSFICRTCLRKTTGRESRAEITMSNYVDKHFGTDYLVSTDSRVNGQACYNYRPDKMYASPGLVLHVECDEHQHYYSGNDYSCDEKRISDIYDEFPGTKYVVIRWNPDKYKVPKGKRPVTTQRDKMEILLACMAEVSQFPPKEEISIYYLFYDQDNPLLSKNIPHHLIYDINDVYPEN